MRLNNNENKSRQRRIVMERIKINKQFTGYGVIDDQEKYNENKLLNAGRDLIKEDTYDGEDQEQAS